MIHYNTVAYHNHTKVAIQYKKDSHFSSVFGQNYSDIISSILIAASVTDVPGPKIAAAPAL